MISPTSHCSSQPTVNRAHGQVLPGQRWAREYCVGGLPPWKATVVCLLRNPHQQKAQALLVSGLCINTTGGISQGIFRNYSNVSFPIVCQPLSEPQLSKPQQAQAASPRIPQPWLWLPLRAGKLALAGYGLSQGIRSVSQLVKQGRGGRGCTPPRLLGTALRHHPSSYYNHSHQYLHLWKEIPPPNLKQLTQTMKHSCLTFKM